MCKKAMQYFENNKSAMAKELTMQMGRPIAQTPGEIDGCIFRANKMIDLAESALSPIVLSSGAGGDDAHRFISRQPLGVVCNCSMELPVFNSGKHDNTSYYVRQ